MDELPGKMKPAASTAGIKSVTTSTKGDYYEQL